MIFNCGTQKQEEEQIEQHPKIYTIDILNFVVKNKQQKAKNNLELNLKIGEEKQKYSINDTALQQKTSFEFKIFDNEYKIMRFQVKQKSKIFPDQILAQQFVDLNKIEKSKKLNQEIPINLKQKDQLIFTLYIKIHLYQYSIPERYSQDSLIDKLAEESANLLKEATKDIPILNTIDKSIDILNKVEKLDNKLKTVENMTKKTQNVFSIGNNLFGNNNNKNNNNKNSDTKKVINSIQAASSLLPDIVNSVNQELNKNQKNNNNTQNQQNASVQQQQQQENYINNLQEQQKENQKQQQNIKKKKTWDGFVRDLFRDMIFYILFLGLLVIFGSAIQFIYEVIEHFLLFVACVIVIMSYISKRRKELKK